MNTTELMRYQNLFIASLFQEVEIDIKELLLGDSVVIQLDKKGHLVYCGDPLSHYYFLIEGSINLYRPTPEGDEKVFAKVESEEVFYESEVFLPEPIATFSAIATEPCVVLQLSSARLIECAAKSAYLASTLLRRCSTHYYQAINRIDTLTTSNASQRFVLYVSELINSYQSNQFELPSTQKHLAKQLNIAPETLSRIIHKLCDTDYLKYDNGHLQVIRPNELRAFVGLPITLCSCQAANANQV